MLSPRFRIPNQHDLMICVLMSPAVSFEVSKNVCVPDYRCLVDYDDSSVRQAVYIRHQRSL